MGRFCEGRNKFPCFSGCVKGEREGNDDDSKFPPPPTPPPPEEEADSILAALAKVMGNQETTHIAYIIGDLLLPCSLSLLSLSLPCSLPPKKAATFLVAENDLVYTDHH